MQIKRRATFPFEVVIFKANLNQFPEATWQTNSDCQGVSVPGPFPNCTITYSSLSSLRD